ncbi:hypothetical protein [Wolbachia endosymbiont of Drosophila mauritiana]|uniref:hypothetical protein n=1 Tax=Wolbachia endosymbiont of Drosophila mauritiana TaxID=109663 RepID=UPI001CDD1300|nr:hypothetical protein [Wolbachia endosymbiont of Drosophila mauritiana]
MFSTSEATRKLFKAIELQNASGERITPEEAWNHFQQALKEGANVNAFEDGMTPLMCITSAFVTSNNEEHQYLELMAKLLVEHKKIDLNIKSKQAVIERRPKEHDGYPVYEFEGRELVDQGRGVVYTLTIHNLLMKDLYLKIMLVQRMKLRPARRKKIQLYTLLASWEM